MSEAVRFGVVGGYGATGSVVVSELWKSSSHEIVIGGRNLAKAKALASQFDGRVTASHLDVFDPSSLDRFCHAASVIVNCGGPVMLLQDRVAQAALHARCHYIDVAGLSFVKERMLPHGEKIAALGLSFVVSAGWLPGLTELLPIYAHAQAHARMDAIDSVSAYFGDSGEWSTSAFRDMAWYLRHLGLRSGAYFRKGQRVRARLRQATPRVDLGDPIGCWRFTLFLTPELEDVGRNLSDCDVLTYSYLPGFRTAMAAATVALVPMPNRWAVWLLRRAFRSVSLPLGGFAVVRVLGRSQGQEQVLTSRLVFERLREYWLNGVVAATTARMVSQGKGVRTGVNFLAEAVEPSLFMCELRERGVDHVEEFATLVEPEC